MTSRNSFPALCSLVLFYLVSQTSAVPPQIPLPPTILQVSHLPAIVRPQVSLPQVSIPPTCERLQIETAVNCGCFLYQPLYESNPVWRGLENLCSKELSGNIAAGQASCESAPFRVSPSAPERVQKASILAADRFFQAVERYCLQFEVAELKWQKAEERLGRADRNDRLKRSDKRSTFEEKADARAEKRAALQEKQDARKGLQAAREERYHRVQRARRKVWPQGRRKKYQENQKRSRAQSPSSSPNPSSKTVSPSYENHHSKVLNEGSSLDSDMLRPVSHLKILSTIRLQPQRVLKRLCVVATIYHGKTPEETEALCCASYE